MWGRCSTQKSSLALCNIYSRTNTKPQCSKNLKQRTMFKCECLRDVSSRTQPATLASSRAVGFTLRSAQEVLVHQWLDGISNVNRLLYTDVIIGIRNAFRLTNSNTQSPKHLRTRQNFINAINLPPHWQCGANRVRVRLAGVTKCDKCGAQNDVTTPLQLSLKCLRDECCCSRF